jgi:hypothetical protein
MAEQKNHNEVAFLARLAGIVIPEDRLPALAMGLSGTQAICDALARLDYGAILPACRFEAPASR